MQFVQVYIKPASAIKHVARNVNVRFLFVKCFVDVSDFKCYQFFNTPVSQTLSVSILSARICTQPTSTVKYVVRKINNCFLQEDNIVVNVCNSECNQSFSSPVVHELNIPNSSLFICLLLPSNLLLSKSMFIFHKNRVLVSVDVSSVIYRPVFSIVDTGFHDVKSFKTSCNGINAQVYKS